MRRRAVRSGGIYAPDVVARQLEALRRDRAENMTLIEGVERPKASLSLSENRA